MKLAAEGAKVCINYCHNEAKARETLEAVRSTGGEAILVRADVSRAEDVKRMFEEAAKAFGGQIDILVNNAGGIVGRKGIEEQDGYRHSLEKAAGWIISPDGFIIRDAAGN